MTVGTVSGGGTATLPEALADPVLTELQAGVYAVMEPELTRMGLPFRCAVAVRGTVISRTSSARSWISVAAASGWSTGRTPIGLEVRSVTVSDEHTTLWTDGPPPALGSTVDMIPGQIRTTFNLHEEVIAVSGGEIVTTWPIAARGSSR